MSLFKYKGKNINSVPGKANLVEYDNTASELEATNVQDAIDELNYKISGIEYEVVFYPGLYDADDNLIQTLTLEQVGTNASGVKSLITSDVKKVILPDGVTSIGNNVFHECTGLTSVTIPSSVISIGSFAFSGCTSLPSITIPNSVIDISYEAFTNCTNLTSITIPDSVISIGSTAFNSCYFTEETFINNSYLDPSVNEYWGATICDSSKSKNGFMITSDGILARYRGSDTVITIPSSVTSIGYGAFHNCTNLTSITIPDSVTSIGEFAFFRCTSLASITIPDSVTSIKNGAFRNVPHIYYNGTATGSPWDALAIN